jgi:hypothetical protein
MKTIKKVHYDFLVEVFKLACQREPVQGEFSFETFNSVSQEPKTKEGVHNCGTFGCIAGGYMPLIDPDYCFSIHGAFCYKLVQFKDSPLYKQNHDVCRALFYSYQQTDFDEIYFNGLLGLKNIGSKATKGEVLENMKTILDNLTIV